MKCVVGPHWVPMDPTPASAPEDVLDVGDIFLDPRYDRFLSLPVVRDGRPVGTISRSHVQQVFMSRFGRELQGSKPIAEFMNPAPLVVGLEHSMAEASQYVTRNIAFPITEDFIVTVTEELPGIFVEIGNSSPDIHAKDDAVHVLNQFPVFLFSPGPGRPEAGKFLFKAGDFFLQRFI